MRLSGTQHLKNTIRSSLVMLALTFPALAADEPKVTESETAASIILGPGQAKATPFRQGSARTGGGNIHITQPSPDTVSVIMTGAVSAKGYPFEDSMASFSFELCECFEVVFHSPRVKGAKLVMWGRIVGLLRSDAFGCKNGGAAEISKPGRAAVSCGQHEILALELAPLGVACRQNLAAYDREGPVWVPVTPGKYMLHQMFAITASHRKGLFTKPASAEFAPEQVLETEWLGKRDPFQGVARKDFGFQVIIKIVADEENADKGKSHN